VVPEYKVFQKKYNIYDCKEAGEQYDYLKRYVQEQEKTVCDGISIYVKVSNQATNQEKYMTVVMFGCNGLKPRLNASRLVVA